MAFDWTMKTYTLSTLIYLYQEDLTLFDFYVCVRQHIFYNELVCPSALIESDNNSKSMFIVLLLALAGNRTCVGVSQVLKRGSGSSNTRLSSHEYTGYFLQANAVNKYLHIINSF